MQFDNQNRQIKLKIVYYGPALGGKTTCLQHIHRMVDPDRRTRLYSLNTANDRTLFFDLLSLDLGKIRGYQLALQLYTVPGQVQYNATRRAVLSGVDGIIFVADSQANQRDANLESLANLWENLKANAIDPTSLPVVRQYNKRDLPALLSVAELDGDLNADSAPAFPSVATSGGGVMEAFAAITEQTLQAVTDKLGVAGNPQAVERLLANARDALSPLLLEQPATVEDAAVLRTEGVEETDAGQPLSEETLVREAVRANVAMADLNARLDTVTRQLRRKVESMATLADFGQAVTVVHDPAEVVKLLLSTVTDLLKVPAASMLAVDRTGGLRPAALRGLPQDPLLLATSPAGESLAARLVGTRQPTLVHRDLSSTVGDPLLLPAVEAAGFGSAVAAPMVAGDRVIGLLCAYSDRRRRTLDEDDLQLASVAAVAAAMAYANAFAWQRLEELNLGLEEQVARRTAELSDTLDEVRRLAAELEGRKTLLEEAYRELSDLDGLRQRLLDRLTGDLRENVSALLTATRALEGSAEAPPERRARIIGVIRDKAEQLGGTLESAIQATVLGRTGRELPCQVVPLEDLLRRVVTPLRPAAQAAQVDLKVLTPSALNAVWCDPDTTAEALRALVKNAIENSRPGGQVKLEVRRATHEGRAWLMIRVKDTGIGISEGDLDHVFEPFWQRPTPGEGPRGAGLGLAIVKRVVEGHGGTVSLTSEPEQGTEVTVALPQDGLTEGSAAAPQPEA